ncbi:thiamine pyrophosphate-binding protein [Halobellus ordinarius]|uniref:thiamine pyrophosphate-binding protein n=1 Tax=Halobellus ordinarius TaxID=3075120 RepID=UPI00288045DC|nr:thiamine pyrophosphate-binding protein [Halobellus sp. ZY16]
MTSSATGADLFVDALETYGVTHLFGNPGTTEVPILRAIEQSELTYLLGLHEDIAVGMAAGYASTRRYHAHAAEADVLPLGVVNLHVAPGLAHGLANIQNAAQSGVPLLVTAGDHGTNHRHEEPILSGDLEEMAREYTKWSAVVDDVSALPTMLRRAVRVALTPPTGPVFLGLPIDVMLAETDARPERLGSIPTAGRGDPEQIVAAARILERADDPALVLGDRVAQAGRRAIDAVTDLAAATGAAVYSEMATAEINYPPEDDHWVSFVAPDTEMARVAFDADTLVFVGCSTNTPYIPYEKPFIPDDATTIHVSDDIWEIGKNIPADVAVVGDPGAVTAELAETVDVSAAERTRRRQSIPSRRDAVEQFLPSSGDEAETDSITKVELADALADTAPDALVVNESNTSKYPLLTRWSLGPEQFIANKNGGLGYALPAAVGAAIATAQAGEKRPVVGFIGDGSYLYYPQAVYSAARYGVDVTIVIPNNRNYRILKDGMIDICGGTDADYDFVGMDIEPPVDIVENARSHGVSAERVTARENLESTLNKAFRVNGPSVVDVQVED